jgi:hypothetical protein
VKYAERRPPDEVEREERAIYVIIMVVFIPVVVALWLDGQVVDAGGTLSLMLIAAGALGLVATRRALRRGSRLPRARVHRERGGDHDSRIR